MVSVTTVPSAVAAPAQDSAHPSSPLPMGAQGSAAATPQPCTAMEHEHKVEVKKEVQSDGPDDDGGQGSSCSLDGTGNVAITGKDLFIYLVSVSLL